MAGHPQSSPRGLWAKLNLDIPTGGGIKLHAYSDSSNLLSGNSTGLVVAGKVKLNNSLYIGANSTAYIIGKRTAVPTTRNLGGIVFVSNSTGSMLAINTTGTTWKYLNVTSELA